jgi:hypothetical protein
MKSGSNLGCCLLVNEYSNSVENVIGLHERKLFVCVMFTLFPHACMTNNIWQILIQTRRASLTVCQIRLSFFIFSKNAENIHRIV